MAGCRNGMRGVKRHRGSRRTHSRELLCGFPSLLDAVICYRCRCMGVDRPGCACPEPNSRLSAISMMYGRLYLPSSRTGNKNGEIERRLRRRRCTLLLSTHRTTLSCAKRSFRPWGLSSCLGLPKVQPWMAHCALLPCSHRASATVKFAGDTSCLSYLHCQAFDLENLEAYVSKDYTVEHLSLS